MAKLTFEWGNAQEAFSTLLSAADSDIKNAVQSGADLLKTYTANKGRSMLKGPYSTGQTIGSVYATTPKRGSDGYNAYVAYKGTNRKGNRNGEVAFLNEYGARGRAARPYNRQAATENKDAIIQRMADIIQKG